MRKKRLYGASLFQKFDCREMVARGSPGPGVGFVFIYFLKDFIYLFLGRGREGEREGEKHQCVVDSCAPPTGDPAHNPGMHPDWESK